MYQAIIPFYRHALCQLFIYLFDLYISSFFYLTDFSFLWGEKFQSLDVKLFTKKNPTYYHSTGYPKPHIVHEPWQPLQICMNSIFWGWPWSFTTDICTSLFTSIWVQLKVIILHGSHSICGEHPQKFCHELGLDFVSRATDLRDFTQI